MANVVVVDRHPGICASMHCRNADSTPVPMGEGYWRFSGVRPGIAAGRPVHGVDPVGIGRIQAPPAHPCAWHKPPPLERRFVAPVRKKTLPVRERISRGRVPRRIFQVSR